MSRNNKKITDDVSDTGGFNAVTVIGLFIVVLAVLFYSYNKTNMRVLPVDIIKNTPQAQHVITINPEQTPITAATPEPILPAAVVCNGEQLFVLNNKTEAQRLLDAVINHYSVISPELVFENIAFVGNVEIKELDQSQSHYSLEYETAYQIAIKPESLLKVELTAMVKEYSAIAYTTTTQEDGSLLLGTREINTVGRQGLAYTISRLRFINGSQTEKSAITEGIVYEPVDEVVLKGTKKVASGAIPGKNEGEKGKSTQELAFIEPVKGSAAVNFGGYNGLMQFGILYSAKEGSDVCAGDKGAVTFAGLRGGYGLLVEIDHGGGFVTRYAHLSTVKVKPGDFVNQAEVIGTAGTTGNVEKSGVQFELWIDGRPYNPRYYMD